MGEGEGVAVGVFVAVGVGETNSSITGARELHPVTISVKPAMVIRMTENFRTEILLRIKEAKTKLSYRINMRMV